MKFQVREKGVMSDAPMKVVADRLTQISPNHAIYTVEDTYLDYGRGWKWTNIIRRGYMDCQVLTPKQWEDVLTCNSFSDLDIVIQEIIDYPYFMDKEAA